MKITHINHSSITFESDNDLLLTDPWLLSNAFQGWSQFPGPNIDNFKTIMGSKSKLSIIVLSHAHDDHVDDIFLSHCDKKVKVVIPKTKNKGFKNRILRSGINSENIFEIEERGQQVGDFFISSISNETLSDEDYIILIKNRDNLLIHSNDNWPEFNQTTIDYINLFIKKNNIYKTILMSQIGIADSYPLFYEGIKTAEKRKIIENKISLMCNALIKNLTSIGLKEGYAYANQSKFTNQSYLNQLDFDPYLIKDEIINSYKSCITQLMPSDQIVNGEYLKFRKDYLTVLSYRLGILEKRFNDYANRKGNNTLKVKFKVINEIKADQDLISLYAPETIWNEILNGKINLESIITGGNGIIVKPLSYNMKEEYKLLTNWAYINQNISTKDLNLDL